MNTTELHQFIRDYPHRFAELLARVQMADNIPVDLRAFAARLSCGKVPEAKAKAKATVTPASTLAALLVIHNDIARFAKHVFGVELTEKQREFCEEFRTERTITRHEPPAWGKTYVAAIAVWWSLVCFDDVRVSIFGPCESAIKVGLWRQVLELHARMAEPFKDMFDISATRISRKTDAASCFAEYRIVSADNASAARGIHAVNNFVFVDDADGVSEIVIAYLMNIMIDRNPKLCLLSTKMNVEALQAWADKQAETRKFVRSRSLQAVEFMFDLMKDESAPVKQRMRAAMWLAEASKPLLTKKLNGAGKSE